MLGPTVAQFQRHQTQAIATRRSMELDPSGHVPSYMLMEATGDSEADCDCYHPTTVGEIFSADDDDAQSCSYDNSETCNACESLNDDDNDEDQRKGDVVYGTSYCEDDEMQEHHKSFVSDDSCHESIDEMEKNRLFWEACLAS